MVNHVRNLLFNESGEVIPVGNVLEEYIPAEYTKKDLTDYLQSVYTLLFPEDNRDMRLLRTHIYLQILHSSFEEDVLSYDPRVTYKFGSVLDLDHLDLVPTLDSLQDLKQISRDLFKDLDTELEYFKYGTSIDRLCSVLLAYVSKVDEL